jgi:hypothetical protein
MSQGYADASFGSPAGSPEAPPRTAGPAFERHYRIGELAEMWKLGRETVRLLVRDEAGVIKVRLGRKKAHTAYSVPESVASRIHTKLLNCR